MASLSPTLLPRPRGTILNSASIIRSPCDTLSYRKGRGQVHPKKEKVAHRHLSLLSNGHKLLDRIFQRLAGSEFRNLRRGNLYLRSRPRIASFPGLPLSHRKSPEA